MEFIDAIVLYVLCGERVKGRVCQRSRRDVYIEADETERVARCSSARTAALAEHWF